ncbi:hypothetical protein STENM327S_01132 [Streptomyces tendae]
MVFQFGQLIPELTALAERGAAAAAGRAPRAEARVRAGTAAGVADAPAVPAGPHDVITCVATLHHLPFTEALDAFLRTWPLAAPWSSSA